MVQLYVIWNVFALAVGAMEARVHHWRGSDIGSDKWIHTFYWSVRAVVFCGLASVIWSYPVKSHFEKSETIVIFLGICLMSFSFFHSGAQFTARRIMDKRLDYHWFSKSSGTNANINLGGVERSILFLASVLVLWLI